MILGNKNRRTNYREYAEVGFEPEVQIEPRLGKRVSKWNKPGVRIVREKWIPQKC